MLSELNIEWFHGTARTFAEEVLAELANDGTKGFAFIEISEKQQGTESVPLVSDVASQQPNLETNYLLGEEPQWSDIHSGRVAPRTCDKELFDVATPILDGSHASTALAITGTAGAGKSTTLMSLALKFSNEGIPVLWIDKSSQAAPRVIRESASRFEGRLVVAIDDADLFGSNLARLVQGLLHDRSKLLVALAVRSGKLDELLRSFGPLTLEVKEHVVPLLTDEDIDGLINVLDHHHRLGRLKGKSDKERRRAFSATAGRQILVAMIEATSGERFEDKVTGELKELSGVKQFVYALVCVASSQRYHLTKDEILLATNSDDLETMDSLNTLVARHLLVSAPPYYYYLARHRVIADLVLDELKEQDQIIKEVINGLVFAAAAKVQPYDNRRSRTRRLLTRFTNHAFLLGLMGPMKARTVYNSIENVLHYDFHYWLQRGALEVEAGDIRLAEQFLDQALSMAPTDHRVRTEYGYMLMRKAVDAPNHARAEAWYAEGTEMLEEIIARDSGVSPHPFHVLGSQGLAWIRRSSTNMSDKRRRLDILRSVLDTGLQRHPFARDLQTLKRDIEKETLMTVATEDNDER